MSKSTQQLAEQFEDDVAVALAKAQQKHGMPIRSRHEGLAILLEEVDEVKQNVFHDESLIELYKELLHVAAMAHRMAVDLRLGEQYESV